VKFAFDTQKKMLLLLPSIFEFFLDWFSLFFLLLLFVFGMWGAEILRLNIKRSKRGRGGKINYVYASQTEVADYNSNTSSNSNTSNTSNINNDNSNTATLSRKCATTTRAGRD